MNYSVALFGNKDTTIEIARHIGAIQPLDLIVTVDTSSVDPAIISGYSSLDSYANEHRIAVFKAKSYKLSDMESSAFFAENTFDIAIVIGWQRLIPRHVLDAFRFGVFGFHGSCAYLPHGRGRSVMNWSLIEGQERFIHHMFRYDEKADSPNVFSKMMFDVNAHDTIRSLQYKSMICSKRMITDLLAAYRQGEIVIHTDTRDFDSFYPKRTPADGRIDMAAPTRQIYNLIRGVTRPFPGAFCHLPSGEKVMIWDAVPFDRTLDFSAYAVGEVLDMYDGLPIVRTLDGSLLIRDYEADRPLAIGDILE